jgi:hypothetical protein
VEGAGNRLGKAERIEGGQFSFFPKAKVRAVRSGSNRPRFAGLSNNPAVPGLSDGQDEAGW